MADSKLDALTELTGSGVASDDWLLVYDTSTGTTKKLAPGNLRGLITGSFAAGDILYHNGTNFVKLAKGAAGQALVQNSALTAPEWGNVGGLQFISSIDLASDATADFTGFDSSKYDSYTFVLQNVRPATNTATLYVRTSSDGGSTYDSGSSDYDGMRAYYPHTTSPAWTLAGNSAGDPQFTLSLGVGNGAGEDGFSGTLNVIGPHLARRTHLHCEGSWENSAGTTYFGRAHCTRESSADVDALRFLFSTGNLSSGTITMYGMRNA